VAAAEKQGKNVANAPLPARERAASSENANSSIASREEGDWKKAKNGGHHQGQKKVKLTPEIK
jgi:hypothetical protein